MSLRHHVLLHRFASVPLRPTVETFEAFGDDKVQVGQERTDVNQEMRWIDIEAVGFQHVGQAVFKVWTHLVAEQTLRLIEFIAGVGRQWIDIVVSIGVRVLLLN